MKWNKTWLLLSIVTMVISLLTGCSGAKKEEPEKVASTSVVSADKPLKGEITFWHSFTQPERQAAIQEMVNDFVKENPGVKVNIEIFPWGTFSTKWKTGLASKALPDISTALVDESLQMAKANAIIPMDEIIQKIGKDRFIEKPIKYLTYEGKVIALPYYTHSRALWYNKSLLADKGIQPPQTWDELLQASLKVQNPPALYGFTLPMNKKDFYSTLYLDIVAKSMGGHILSKDGKVTLTDPKVLQAIQYLADAAKKVAPPGAPGHGLKESNDLFQQGKIAFTFESGFMINQILQANPEMKDNFGAVAPPKLTGSNDTGWVSDYITMVRWSSSKYPEITAKLLEFMYQKERYIKFLHVVPGGMLPALKDISDSKEFNDHPVIQKYKKEVDILKSGVAEGSPIASEFGMNPAVNIIKTSGMIEDMFTKIVTAGTPIDQAAKEAEVALNKLIQEQK
jgi:multiple sugar transport system substrate-binding protein